MHGQGRQAGVRQSQSADPELVARIGKLMVGTTLGQHASPAKRLPCELCRLLFTVKDKRRVWPARLERVQQADPELVGGQERQAHDWYHAGAAYECAQSDCDCVVRCGQVSKECCERSAVPAKPAPTLRVSRFRRLRLAPKSKSYCTAASCIATPAAKPCLSHRALYSTTTPASCCSRRQPGSHVTKTSRELMLH